MRYFVALSIFLLASVGATSQTVKIYGQVVDSVSGPIPGSTVMLIGAKDSILKSFSVSDKAGTFLLTNIKPGEYIFKVSFFGYQPFEKLLVIGSGSKDTTLARIQLQSKMLNAVNVQGHYIPIQLKGDTIEYDSRAFETSEHDVVEDLLKQLPGIEVAEDGSIKAQGKDVDKILVDGEEFFGDDPTIATKNLPANAVEKVQVFDKESEMSEFTGVSEGNETTTINLKLKDTHKKGLFGNIEMAGGTDAPVLDGEKVSDIFRYMAKGNIHYFKKKWQFSIIGMGNNINETGFSVRDYINFMGGMNNLMRSGGAGFNMGGGLPISESSGSNTGFLRTNAGGFNYNFKPSEKTTLSSSLFLNNFDKTYLKNVDRTTYFSDSSLFTNEAVDQRSSTFNNRGNIRLEQKFDSTHFLNIDLSGSWDKSNYLNGNDIRNYGQSANQLSGFLTQLNQDNFAYDFTAEADYRKKFAKAGRYTGGGASYTRSNSDASTALDYLRELYFNGSLASIDISQIQNLVQTTGAMNANWMWSEPMGKRQLIQIEARHQNNLEQRDKKVFDIDTLGEQSLNDFFSADGSYFNFRQMGNIRHKYISTKLKTTARIEYLYLNLSGDSIFTAPKQFHYALPAADFHWEPNKSSDLRMNYSTSVTAPALNQLQPLPDNSNPSEVILGNIDLEPEYTHNLEFSFHNFNEFNFTHFIASVNANYTQNNIAYSQIIDSFLIRKIIPTNLGTEKGANSYLAFGASLHPIHTKFNLSNASNISNGIVQLNGDMDQYTSISTTPKITIENINKGVVSVRAGFTYTWSQNLYRDNAAFNNNFNNYSYFGNFTLKIKERWEVKSDLTHYFYPNFTTNKQQVILNARIGVNLLETKTLQIFIQGKDLLNQNTGISQYYYQNMYEQQTTSTLARYFLVGLKYSFTSLGAAK